MIDLNLSGFEKLPLQFWNWLTKLTGNRAILIGRMQGIREEGMLDIGQSEFLVLFFMVQAQQNAP